MRHDQHFPSERRHPLRTAGPFILTLRGSVFNGRLAMTPVSRMVLWKIAATLRVAGPCES